MDRYTIHCTEEQTQKAIELGAPTELESEYYNPTENDFKLENPIACSSFTNGYHYAKCPTADQMVGWLDEQGVFIEVGKSFVANYQSVVHNTQSTIFYDEYLTSREEATMVAIDTALDYLLKNKK